MFFGPGLPVLFFLTISCRYSDFAGMKLTSLTAELPSSSNMSAAPPGKLRVF